MTKKDNQSPEDSKSTENNTEENKDLNTLSYEELLQKVADSEDEILRSRAELENFKKTIEDNNNHYESMLDKTTQSLEKIISNTESLSKIQ